MTSALTVAGHRQQFATAHAATLAAHTGGPTHPEDSRLKLSTVASFFGDAHSLVVISGPHPTPAQDRDADHAVAYGLDYAGGRRRVAVLPDDASHPVLTRGPWLRDIDVGTYDFESVWEKGDLSSLEPRCIPSPEQVFEMYRKPVYADAQHLGDHQFESYLNTERAGWVDRLTRWAEEDPDLDAAHRQSYLARQCQGRMVLKVAKAKGALRVTAGVHRADPANRPDPQHVTGLIAPATAHRLIAAASSAAADRLDCTDKGHQEHRLQAALATELRDLGIRHPKREYPFIPSDE